MLQTATDARFYGWILVTAFPTNQWRYADVDLIAAVLFRSLWRQAVSSRQLLAHVVFRVGWGLLSASLF